MYKTETHLHTAEVSRCGKLKAYEMLKFYSEAGYATVFVTDHFTVNFLASLGDIPWRDKVAIFMSGYYRAREEGKKYNLTVLPAAEFSVDGNDYLAYGISEGFLLDNPDLLENGMEHFYNTARKNNVFIVQAHPYRGNCFPTPSYVDGMEAYNANPRHDDSNDKALETAIENSLPFTAGSDAHRTEDVCQSGVLTYERIETSEQFIKLVKERKVKIYKVGEEK